ncbi:hypothetical protein V6B95_14020 [Thermoanaerobacterium saccharolyticum]|uniref:hypothetical protein n=1 Tax=Thermoanaerobacterium aotearoense TaxID=47490 RepID=UPI0002EC01BA|nr:hypothetical protein [Thermoanaerobacterium aotearoense]
MNAEKKRYKDLVKLSRLLHERKCRSLLKFYQKDDVNIVCTKKLKKYEFYSSVDY